MVFQVQIGTQTLEDDKILPLLAQYQLLSKLAREIIIEQVLTNTPKLDITPEEAQTALQQFSQQMQFTSEEIMQQWLQKNGLQPEQLQVIALRPLRLAKFKQQEWGGKVVAYFMERKSTLDRMIYSLIRTSDGGIAQELYFRILDDPNSFAELARQYSQGAEAQTGGLVGPVEMSIPHPGIAKILAQSQPGELQNPVKIGEWYVLLRLEKLIPAQLDETMRQRLIEEQFETWLNQELANQFSVQQTNS